MERKGHYLKPGKRASAPGSLFTVEIETKNRFLTAKNRAVAQKFGQAYLTHCVWRRGKWGRLDTGEADTPDGVRSWMEERACNGRINWVVAPQASGALTLLEWWSYAERSLLSWVRRKGGRPVLPPDHAATGGVYLDTICLSEPPCIVGYTQWGTRWRWVSDSNYFGGVGDGTVHGGAGDDSTGAGRDAGPVRAVVGARDRAIGSSRRFQALCQWWRHTARSAFSTTVGGLAIGILRSHTTGRGLCTHTDGDAHRLERDGAFGGRATCWYVGSIGERRTDGPGLDADPARGTANTVAGPLTHVDVRSMYPALLRDMLYPVKINTYREDVPVRAALELAHDCGVIARVTFDTNTPEYPLRKGERVLYPVGRIQTTLTGPELLRAAQDGEILRCHALSIYKMGRPFSAAADAMLRSRHDARSVNDASGECFAKLLANSLAGKLAQRSGGWVRNANLDTPGEWGETYYYDLRTNVRVRVRTLAGLSWVWTPDASGRGPYTAAFAYLAAYGRLQMRAIRECLPDKTIVSQDTDGLWVLPDGIEALASLDWPADGSPGQLRVTDTVDSARFYGPKHYQSGERWTLAGYHEPHMMEDGRTITDTFTQSMWGQKLGAAPTETIKVVRKSILSLADLGGSIGADGWVSPWSVGRPYAAFETEQSTPG